MTEEKKPGKEISLEENIEKLQSYLPTLIGHLRTEISILEADQRVKLREFMKPFVSNMYDAKLKYYVGILQFFCEIKPETAKKLNSLMNYINYIKEKE